MRKQKGISLLELLIVVAVILIIAAIAVPNLLRSRMAANEASAVGSLRSVITAEGMYLSSQAQPAYGTLPQLAAANLLGSIPVKGVKSGYALTIALTGGGTGFDAQNAPVTLNLTGTRCFFADQTGTIRAATAATCNQSAQPILWEGPANIMAPASKLENP